MRRASSQLISILVHLCAIALLLMLSAHWGPVLVPSPEKQNAVILFAPPVLRSASPAGGGSRTPAPPRRGDLPHPAHHTFILPAAHPVSNPSLPVVSVIGAPDIQTPAGLPGLPNGVIGGIGTGPGGPSGIGDNCCGGIGTHNGDGLDGAAWRQPLTPARLIYKIDPEFSEEARKAKFSGMVLISIEILSNGLPADLRVVRSLGMGLDEKALEAVAKWRFRPALRAGKPVASSAVVEVHFHLL